MHVQFNNYTSDTFTGLYVHISTSLHLYRADMWDLIPKYYS